MQKESAEVVLNIFFPFATDLLLTYVDHWTFPVPY